MGPSSKSRAWCHPLRRRTEFLEPGEPRPDTKVAELPDSVFAVLEMFVERAAIKAESNGHVDNGNGKLHQAETIYDPGSVQQSARCLFTRDHRQYRQRRRTNPVRQAPRRPDARICSIWLVSSSKPANLISSRPRRHCSKRIGSTGMSPTTMTGGRGGAGQIGLRDEPRSANPAYRQPHAIGHRRDARHRSTAVARSKIRTWHFTRKLTRATPNGWLPGTAGIFGTAILGKNGVHPEIAHRSHNDVSRCVIMS